ncbi:unnamed protein product [Schistocephalus solidus]|uniref:Uncharacterized protein n=1 Tax=Schistocephalus solidus TaxID=70667 RepID=A0A183TQS1_SCHSO|nr:unnamed protein product [Schistocephalus solidus]
MHARTYHSASAVEAATNPSARRTLARSFVHSLTRVMFFAPRSGRLQEPENLLVPAALPTTDRFSPSDGMGYQHAVNNSGLDVTGAVHLYPTADVCSRPTNGLLLADPNTSSSSSSSTSPPKMSAVGPTEQHPHFWDQTHSTKLELLVAKRVDHRFVQCQHVPLPPSQTLLFPDPCSAEMLGSVTMVAPTMSHQLVSDFPMQGVSQGTGAMPVGEQITGHSNEDGHVDSQTHQWDIKDIRLPNVSFLIPCLQ